MKKHEIKLLRGSRDPQSVQYGHSVQYGLGLLHATMGNGPPIALTLLSRIHHEISSDSQSIQSLNGASYGAKSFFTFNELKGHKGHVYVSHTIPTQCLDNAYPPAWTIRPGHTT